MFKNVNTDFLDNIEGIVIDPKYIFDDICDKYANVLTSDKLSNVFDFEKTLEENMVAKYTNMVKKYGNEANYDKICSCLISLYDNYEKNERKITLLKEIVRYLIARKNYNSMLKYKDRIMHVINIIQQMLRDICDYYEIKVKLALCEYVTIHHSSAPFGTFQYLLKIYSGIDTLEQYIIISGEDYPYTVTSMYGRKYSYYDVMERGTYVDKIMAKIYNRYDFVSYIGYPILPTNNIIIHNEKEWKQNITHFTSHIHVSLYMNEIIFSHIKRLQGEIEELNLMPYGSEYTKIKNNFESHQKNQNVINNDISNINQKNNIKSVIESKLRTKFHYDNINVDITQYDEDYNKYKILVYEDHENEIYVMVDSDIFIITPNDDMIYPCILQKDGCKFNIDTSDLWDNHLDKFIDCPSKGLWITYVNHKN